MLEDPMLFSVVKINMYSAPAARLGIEADVVSTLLIESTVLFMGWLSLKIIKSFVDIEYV